MSRMPSARPAPEHAVGRVVRDLGVAALCAVAGSLLLVALEPGAHAGHDGGFWFQLLSMLACTTSLTLIVVPVAADYARATPSGDQKRYEALVVGAAASAAIAVGAWLHAGLGGVNGSFVHLLGD